MSGLVTAITTGIVAFSATNIDDFVILLLLFSQVNDNFRHRHILIGQYLGFGGLVVASFPGFLGGLILPRHWIGLIGLIPIVIGLNLLLNREEEESEEVEAETNLSEDSPIASFFSPQVYSVAAITLANGSDNVSVYVPLFANSNLGNLVLILSTFLILVGVWCYVAYKLTNQQAIASILTRYGNAIAPFILIGLGAFIVWDSEALSLVKLIATCLCLAILVKNDEQLTESEED
ncbi:MAG TPA: transporter [Cyanobacteria bacterium UBA11372]|nr:transporter [Cyanobacteria bacterium UBA11372]